MSFYKIRPRSGTLAQWEYSNPILGEREIGYVVPDNGVGTGEIKMKMGDGVTHWNDLPYATNFDERIVQNATTDSETKVPSAKVVKNVQDQVNTKMTIKQKPFTGDITPDEIFELIKDNINTCFSWASWVDVKYNPLGKAGAWLYEILNVNKSTIYLYLRATKVSTGEQWIYSESAGWIKTSLGTKKYGTLTVVNANNNDYSYVRTIGGEFGILKITCLIPSIEAWQECVLYTSDVKPTNEVVFVLIDQETREAVRCLFNTEGQVIAQAKGKAFAGGWVGGSCTFM